MAFNVFKREKKNEKSEEFKNLRRKLYVFFDKIKWKKEKIFYTF